MVKYIALLLCALTIASCHKTKPRYHPTYIGTWVNAHANGWFDSDIKIVIDRDGYAYEQWGYHRIYSGECKIKTQRIFIGDRNHRIDNAPHRVDTMLLTETLVDTPVSSSVKMTLCLKGEVCSIDFYKVP